MLWEKLENRIGVYSNSILVKEKKPFSPVSLIASNCIGGTLYHDHGMEFLSPTINMYFEAADFIRFCLRISHYLSYPGFVSLPDSSYPKILIDDVTIHGLHYASDFEFWQCWSRRKKRVVLSNIVIILSDRDGMTDSLFSDFISLPYRKIYFSHKPIEIPSEVKTTTEIVYIPEFRHEKEVGVLTRFNARGQRLYEKYFDFSRWLEDHR
jgi:uncharacterized protein (DUF1919 family)